MTCLWHLFQILPKLSTKFMIMNFFKCAANNKSKWQKYIMFQPYSLDFTSCFLKADDYEARRKACGVCLLNVDARSPASCLSGEVGSKALSYGGRQYHTTCANFWINCVSQTLPSLTIPELL